MRARRTAKSTVKTTERLPRRKQLSDPVETRHVECVHVDCVEHVYGSPTETGEPLAKPLSRSVALGSLSVSARLSASVNICPGTGPVRRVILSRVSCRKMGDARAPGKMTKLRGIPLRFVHLSPEVLQLVADFPSPLALFLSLSLSLSFGDLFFSSEIK